MAEEATGTLDRAGPILATHAAACTCDMQNDTGPTGQIRVFRVAGGLGMLTLLLVQAALPATMDQPPRDLVVDLAAVSLPLCARIRPARRHASIAHASGIGYAVSELNTRLDRIATMLWTEQNLVRTAISPPRSPLFRIDQTYRLAPAARPPATGRESPRRAASGETW